MLTNSIKTRSSLMFMRMNQLRAFSAMKEYDVAVIGGGPGGKSQFFPV